MSAVVEVVEGEVTVTCPATAARCRCRHEPPHVELPHECIDVDACNGAWRGSDADGGSIEVVRHPYAGGLGPIADLAMGLST